ncbi:phosphate-starvation-inducible protein E [Hydrogenivirga caldilitoris]|uniref:Phosphate-starvation-inducible protein E n=1 Tax=Hydrogenivirga caldilitoris TaxID=246264 RepID=A0A497XQ41_9AQUI|nr:protoglobin domain-containing protein [Hydrogenivirga caldilitoris]RLJ70401.1 phosphate-starvation-inducible protein E [Hydrogenivirga caldilitoris]
METIEELKVHYRWSKKDEENLRKVAWLGESYADEFIERFYNYLENFRDTSLYLPDEETRKRHKDKVKRWFAELFLSKYDAQYLRRLYRIGEVHLRIGLPPHYVQASMNFVRDFIAEKLTEHMGCSPERDEIIASINKALDLNLDVMVNSFREEELKVYLSSGKLQRVLIENIRRVSWFFDIFIITALSGVGLFLILWIGYEFFLVATGELPLERGGLGILGSVLILYAISELLSEEIKHIRGGAISIKVFVGVALAALIRKVLIISLSPEKFQELITLSITTLALGVVFWLIYKVEGRR